MSPDRQESKPEGLVLRSNESVLTRPQISKLAQLNPLTAILNPVAYEINFGTSAEKFHPDNFDAIHVAWVQVTPDRKELLILDGLHRTSVADEHYDEITRRFPDFRFVIRNVTGTHLLRGTGERDQQPGSIMPTDMPEELAIEAQAHEFPPALTIEQYMHATIDTMQHHKNILPLRVAGTLMKRWNGFVGDALYEKFSGLAALAYLENPNVPNRDRDPAKLKEYLDRQTEFFAGDTRREREAIRAGLITMEDLITRHRISRSDAASSAFIIVGTQADIIGGRDATIRQIAGLLHTPNAYKKLRDSYGSGEALGIGIREVSRRLANAGTSAPHRATKELRPIYEALTDPTLEMADFTTVLRTQPQKREISLEAIRAKKRAASFKERYQTDLGLTTLSLFEESAIDAVAAKDPRIMGPMGFQHARDMIFRAARLREDADRLLKRIETTRLLDADEKNQLTRALESARASVTSSIRGMSISNIHGLKTIVADIEAFFLDPHEITLFQKGQAVPNRPEEREITTRPPKRHPTETENPEAVARRIRERANKLASELNELPAAQVDAVRGSLLRLRHILGKALGEDDQE